MKLIFNGVFHLFFKNIVGFSKHSDTYVRKVLKWFWFSKKWVLFRKQKLESVLVGTAFKNLFG